MTGAAVHRIQFQTCCDGCGLPGVWVLYLSAGRWRVVKVSVLSCESRRRKDRCDRAYCGGKKIRACTEFQHSPPAIVADCLRHECNTVVERRAGPWHSIFV